MMEEMRHFPLWSIWIEGKGGGVEYNRIDLTQN